ncbi:replicative DNA helicase [Streptomyces sp. NPDC002640]
MTSTNNEPSSPGTASEAVDDPSRVGNVLENALNQLEAVGSASKKRRRKFGLLGLETGFTDLDALTSGLEPGTLTVVASRPSMGRTTLLSDISRHNAVKMDVPTLVFTLEETQIDFTNRILAAQGRIARHHMRSGTMDEDAWTRLARIMPTVVAAPLYVQAPPRIDMVTLRIKATELVEQHSVKLIAVDGIQDIRPWQRSDLREREVGDIVRDLKAMARELNVAVVATSHLNRGAEQRWDKKPQLDDLRESGAITFAADTIILLHRDDYYEKESPRAGEADFIVAKHRHGPTATIAVAFQGHYGRFVDMAQP